jgi:hypothetical protein
MSKQTFKEDKKGYIKDVLQGIGFIGIIFLIIYLVFAFA